jgi:hypothetical protein
MNVRVNACVNMAMVVADIWQEKRGISRKGKSLFSLVFRKGRKGERRGGKEKEGEGGK